MYTINKKKNLIFISVNKKTIYTKMTNKNKNQYI